MARYINSNAAVAAVSETDGAWPRSCKGYSAASGSIRLGSLFLTSQPVRSSAGASSQPTVANYSRGGNAPFIAMHWVSGAPLFVRIGWVLGSAEVLRPSPPYTVARTETRATFWLIGNTLPSVGAQPLGQKLPPKIRT